MTSIHGVAGAASTAFPVDTSTTHTMYAIGEFREPQRLAGALVEFAKAANLSVSTNYTAGNRVRVVFNSAADKDLFLEHLSNHLPDLHDKYDQIEHTPA